MNFGILLNFLEQKQWQTLLILSWGSVRGEKLNFPLLTLDSFCWFMISVGDCLQPPAADGSRQLHKFEINARRWLACLQYGPIELWHCLSFKLEVTSRLAGQFVSSQSEKLSSVLELEICTQTELGHFLKFKWEVLHQPKRSRLHSWVASALHCVAVDLWH